MDRDEFFEFSNAGNSDPHDDSVRWDCDLHVKSDVAYALELGKPIENWDARTRFTPKVRGPVEDMPWTNGHVMSSKLKDILNRFAPNHIQFLPVRVLYGNTPFEEVGQYWVANYLKVTDCLMSKSAAIALGKEHEPFPDATTHVLHAELVDPDIKISRIRTQLVTCVIRRELRDILTEHQVTGCQYYRIRQV